jgi:hypothetical protein
MNDSAAVTSGMNRLLQIPDKRTIFKAQMTGGAIWAAAYFGAYYGWHPATADVGELDTFFLAVQLCAIPAVLIQVLVLALARMFDTPEAENPFLGKESQRHKLNARVLQNTVEQTLIIIPLLLVLSLRIEAEHARVIPILMGTWMLGRVLFWAGYYIGPPWRYLGFASSTASNLTAIVWLVRSFLV